MTQEEGATRLEFLFSESHLVSDLVKKAADVLKISDTKPRPWLRKNDTDSFQYGNCCLSLTINHTNYNPSMTSIDTHNISMLLKLNT